jgi:hypothetical protein
MTVTYSQRKWGLVPVYYCWRKPEPVCQTIHGLSIDQEISRLLLEMVAPMALEATLEVHAELERRFEETLRLHEQQVERIRYECEQARQRFVHVDPANRLVAATLEAEWNTKLKELAAAHEELERRRHEDARKLSEEKRSKIRKLASDFPKLWNDPETPDRERKRMLRLLIEDVTLLRDHDVKVHVRFRGGATRSLTLPLPKRVTELRKTPPETVAAIDRLLDDHPADEVAEILNARGIRTATGLPFSEKIVDITKRNYGLEPRDQRLRKAGLKTLEQIAAALRVGHAKLNHWRETGQLELRAHRVGGQRFFYEMPADLPVTSRSAPSTSAPRAKS